MRRILNSNEQVTSVINVKYIYTYFKYFEALFINLGV